jgi:hypothetical protein
MNRTISREELIEIVKDELEQAFPGNEDLMRLARGIATEMNVSHSGKTGRFVPHSQSDCESSYFVDGKRKGKGDRVDSGRGKYKNRGTGSEKCSTGEKKPVNEGEDEQTAAYIEAVVAREVRKAFQEFKKHQKQSKSGCSTQELLKFINSYSSAEKGDLNKKG